MEIGSSGISVEVSRRVGTSAIALVDIARGEGKRGASGGADG
jgi:hypothetical protein